MDSWWSWLMAHESVLSCSSWGTRELARGRLCLVTVRVLVLVLVVVYDVFWFVWYDFRSQQKPPCNPCSFLVHRYFQRLWPLPEHIHHLAEPPDKQRCPSTSRKSHRRPQLEPALQLHCLRQKRRSAHCVFAKFPLCLALCAWVKWVLFMVFHAMLWGWHVFSDCTLELSLMSNCLRLPLRFSSPRHRGMIAAGEKAVAYHGCRG